MVRSRLKAVPSSTVDQCQLEMASWRSGDETYINQPRQLPFSKSPSQTTHHFYPWTPSHKTTNTANTLILVKMLAALVSVLAILGVASASPIAERQSGVQVVRNCRNSGQVALTFDGESLFPLRHLRRLVTCLGIS